MSGSGMYAGWRFSVRGKLRGVDIRCTRQFEEEGMGGERRR